MPAGWGAALRLLGLCASLGEESPLHQCGQQHSFGFGGRGCSTGRVVCTSLPLYPALRMGKLASCNFGRGSVSFCPACGSQRLAVGSCCFCLTLLSLCYSYSEFGGTLGPLA